jgi:hypothetical protein
MRTLCGLALLLVVLAVPGCVALPALAPAAVNAGGDLVKAGTVRMGGATYRTFSVPLAELYRATRTTLEGLGFATPEEEMVEERVTLRARGVDRTVRIDLQPITGSLTQMRVFVRKETLGKDPATAMELVEQTGLVLDQRLTRGKVSQRRTPAR